MQRRSKIEISIAIPRRGLPAAAKRGPNSHDKALHFVTDRSIEMGQVFALVGRGFFLSLFLSALCGAAGCGRLRLAARSGRLPEAFLCTSAQVPCRGGGRGGVLFYTRPPRFKYLRLVLEILTRFTVSVLSAALSDIAALNRAGSTTVALKSELAGTRYDS